MYIYISLYNLGSFRPSTRGTGGPMLGPRSFSMIPKTDLRRDTPQRLRWSKI